MIQITQIIDYLRANLTTCQVDGAASLAYAEDNSRLMTNPDGGIIPAVYVMLGTCTATVLSPSTFLEDYDERLVIIACTDNTLDRTGKSAQQFMYALRKAIFSILLNYVYDPQSFSLQFIGDSMLKMDRALYWHQFEFSLKGRLDYTDGAPLQYITDLNELVISWNSPDPLADQPIMTDQIILNQPP